MELVTSGSVWLRNGLPIGRSPYIDGVNLSPHCAPSGWSALRHGKLLKQASHAFQVNYQRRKCRDGKVMLDLGVIGCAILGCPDRYSGLSFSRDIKVGKCPAVEIHTITNIQNDKSSQGPDFGTVPRRSRKAP